MPVYPWQQVYKAAVLECDPAKLASLGQATISGPNDRWKGSLKKNRARRRYIPRSFGFFMLSSMAQFDPVDFNCTTARAALPYKD
jgi:hypothetical protein